MRHWIGLIVIMGGAYYLWTQYGADAMKKKAPATPEVAWYLDEVEHHFSIVPERGGAWFLRGFHKNTTTSYIVDVTIKVFLRDGDEWSPLETFHLGVLESEERKTFDKPIRVPPGLENPKLRWEIVSVRRR